MPGSVYFVRNLLMTEKAIVEAIFTSNCSVRIIGDREREEEKEEPIIIIKKQLQTKMQMQMLFQNQK
jgi:hypothetical protein